MFEENVDEGVEENGEEGVEEGGDEGVEEWDESSTAAVVISIAFRLFDNGDEGFRAIDLNVNMLENYKNKFHCSERFTVLS